MIYLYIVIQNIRTIIGQLSHNFPYTFLFINLVYAWPCTNEAIAIKKDFMYGNYFAWLKLDTFEIVKLDSWTRSHLHDCILNVFLSLGKGFPACMYILQTSQVCGMVYSVKSCIMYLRRCWFSSNLYVTSFSSFHQSMSLSMPHRYFQSGWGELVDHSMYIFECSVLRQC